MQIHICKRQKTTTIQPKVKNKSDNVDLNSCGDAWTRSLLLNQKPQVINARVAAQTGRMTKHKEGEVLCLPSFALWSGWKPRNDLTDWPSKVESNYVVGTWRENNVGREKEKAEREESRRGRRGASPCDGALFAYLNVAVRGLIYHSEPDSFFEQFIPKKNCC